MTRKCSHCGHNGHNSRTCPNRGVKLFGVRLTDGPIRKSVSMGNLLHYSGSSCSASPSLMDPSESLAAAADGYVSDGLVHNSSSSNSRERKKGVPWTEEEHRMFLLGLQKLGKGDWRGISRKFVPTRTPTQVASHAQKYFMRQSNLTRRKRRCSLFDITAEPPPPPSPCLPVVSSQSVSDQEEAESVENSGNSGDPEIVVSRSQESASGDPAVYPGFVTPFVPFGFPLWPTFRPAMPPNSNVFKPTAKLPTAPIKIDECAGLSQLSIGDAPGNIEPSELSLRLHGRPSRQSAFQANPPLNDNNSFNSNGNVISVV